MIVDNLVTHVVTGETDNSFVGMKIIGNQIRFYYPESYHFCADDFDKDDVLDLLKTISIAKSSSKDISETYDSRQTESDLAFFSYIWIIEDYLKNGFYIYSEKLLKVNQRGRINWKKTFQQQPIISSGNIIYTNLYTEVKSTTESVLVEAHRYCVKKSIKLIGWIYGLKPEAIEVVSNADKLTSYYLNAIRTELDCTFDDDKRSKLIHMENVLIGLDEKENDNDIVYGVDSYHYIFERMIDSIFGTEKVDDYYPSFTWHLKYSNKSEGLSGPTIRPDTIMRHGDDKNIYIIDSKFYRFGSLNLAQTKGLPEASSIVKQITYGSYVKSKYPESDVYNIFILPYDSESDIAGIITEDDKRLVYIGEVESSWESDKTYGKIYTLLVDLKYVVKTWNRMMHTDDRDALVDKVKAVLKS